jgi:hypothetical protein
MRKSYTIGLSEFLCSQRLPSILGLLFMPNGMFYLVFRHFCFVGGQKDGHDEM